MGKLKRISRRIKKDYKKFNSTEVGNFITRSVRNTIKREKTRLKRKNNGQYGLFPTDVNNLTDF